MPCCQCLIIIGRRIAVNRSPGRPKQGFRRSQGVAPPSVADSMPRIGILPSGGKISMSSHVRLGRERPLCYSETLRMGAS